MPRRLDVLAALQKFAGSARSRSLRRGARSACSRGSIRSRRRPSEIRPGFADGRCGALRDQKTDAPWRRLDLPRGPHRPGEGCRVYVQKAQHFALPADPNKPIIMIGPGTGIAPFRAFLQERHRDQCAGPNWLYFGHQRSDYDFFYKEELRPCARRAISPA